MKVRYIGPDIPGALLNGKVYVVLAVEEDWYRVVDESGEDYLYSKSRFQIVEA